MVEGIEVFDDFGQGCLLDFGKCLRLLLVVLVLIMWWLSNLFCIFGNMDLVVGFKVGVLVQMMVVFGDNFEFWWMVVKDLLDDFFYLVFDGLEWCEWFVYYYLQFVVILFCQLLNGLEILIIWFFSG